MTEEKKSKEDVLLERYSKLADELKAQKAKVAELEESLQEAEKAREATRAEEPSSVPDEGKSAVDRWVERQMKREKEKEERLAQRTKVRTPREIEEQSADVLSRMLKDVQEE